MKKYNTIKRIDIENIKELKINIYDNNLIKSKFLRILLEIYLILIFIQKKGKNMNIFVVFVQWVKWKIFILGN